MDLLYNLAAAMPGFLIAIPTYNESQNLRQICREALRQATAPAELLIIDDASPDGTGALAEELARQDSRIHVLRRPRKLGLGSAYQRAFSWALERGFSAVCQMDGDLSHDPRYLPRFQRLLAEGADGVVGSRYVEGGGIADWGWVRRLISRWASVYARAWLGVGIGDLTGGFNAWTAELLKKIDPGSMRSEGYCFQIELKFRALRHGFRLVEQPIVFTDRRRGRSKMSWRVLFEAAWRVPLLGLRARVGARRGRRQP